MIIDFNEKVSILHYCLREIFPTCKIIIEFLLEPTGNILQPAIPRSALAVERDGFVTCSEGEHTLWRPMGHLCEGVLERDYLGFSGVIWGRVQGNEGSPWAGDAKRKAIL